ncbi:hypothetical protein [Actinophytocola oryzae]|uniref:PE family protein n=1 Tax=Actinophytocola oryzae TaxID=502181 RepID=A0A4R7VF47_9PSEU|nr:hypothetical protein [Actinophytocola oryzae]TDV47842.1 hypothetical protein CLV71_10977 [Actinophytocola oryzae]
MTNRDDIEARLGDMFTGHTTEPTSTGGGSFTYFEPDLRTIIKNWLELADSYHDSLYNSGYMSRIRPPAEDFASRAHTSSANRSGESYGRYLEHNRDYCRQQAQLFQNALDDYLGVEHTNVTDITKATAPQGPQPGV